MMRRGLLTAVMLTGLGSAVLPASAESDQWWPMKVVDLTSGKPIEVGYTPVDKATKAYSICVLLPHMKDSYFVALAYGIVRESERSNVNMKLYEAGGYENLPRQLSQFDDCMASGSDAIVVAPISEAGFAKKFAEAQAKGIKVIGTANPISAGQHLPAMIYADFTQLGMMTGKAIADMFSENDANVVTFPGPAGSGWAESFNEGFKAAATKNPKVHILGEKFGDSGVAVQLQLVQDALQAYPDMNVIWGTGPTAEAAIGAVAEVGRTDMVIISAYENQALLDALNRGEIDAFATQYPVGIGRISIDLAVRALDGQPIMAFVQPIPEVVTKDTQKDINMSLILAPSDWTPVYNVQAK